MTRRLLAASLACALLAPAAPALASDPPDGALLTQRRQQMLSDLAALRFERLGDPVLRWDHIPPVTASKERPHELLVVLVEYPDVAFDRFAGQEDQGAKLAEWYQGQLFDPAYAKPGSLSHYYWNQSLGQYHLQGLVLPPVKLSKPRAAYGTPVRPEGGSWRNDSDSEGMVEEVLLGLSAAHPDLDWSAFDRWDPNDADGDGVLAEPDGYLDHFVLVFAGGGQSSCQRLYKIDDVLTPNAGAEALDKLTPEARSCAERMWPHRFMVQKRTGEGPVVEGRRNARGGVPIQPDLWARDYNMQSEYTDASTFIHEFGHSIGLPDIYARTSQNSTGGWEVMSGTASPLPQSFSAWSRMMLGWLRPAVIVPPEAGGKGVQSTYLRVLDDAGAPGGVDADLAAGVARAAMVVLPPKTIHIDLGGLPKAGGTRALYSGQGNELNRAMELRLDLRGMAGPVALEMDAWWDIEGGWDFAYLESTIDGGHTWRRHVTEDRRLMPAKHGHDGADTLPGFTGLSGDMDGDGKNEQRKDCDPKKQLAHGEDAAGTAKDPCLEPSWVRARFVMGDLAGNEARVRLRYFTDMAAVQRGIMVDNLVVRVGEGKGAKVVAQEDFEGEPNPAVRQGEFTPSEGRHTLLVPHYYVLELRDPYAPVGAGEHRYDSALADPVHAFWADPTDGTMKAIAARYRPGVLAWYYDGELAWSENDPATAGQGRGFLLAVDAWPDEVAIPGWDRWLQGTPGHFDTGYDVSERAAQEQIGASFLRTQCFVRSAAYRAQDLGATPGQDCPQERGEVEALEADGKPMIYSYEAINRLLPGPDRDKYEKASELVDYRIKDGKIVWRMRDVTLRYLHAMDAPFWIEPFADQAQILAVQDGHLSVVEHRAAPAVARFENAPRARWMNPRLFFGGVAVPAVPIAFELAKPAAGAPADARVKVYVDWNP